MAEKVMIGMSGGVDSSVAALLLRQAGYACLGVTMQMHAAAAEDACGGAGEIAEARRAAKRLGILHFVLDARDDFSRCVIEPFINTYETGGTPNPCIRCNRLVKFPAMLRFATEHDCQYIATGHYARVEQRPDGRWLLKKGLDSTKDQSYVLYGLSQEILSRLRFPLGELSKPRVRTLAGENGLENAQRRDSQDICFIPDGDYEAYIRRSTGREYPAGDFVDEEGRVLGRHRGIIGYTIGQRRGLGISAEKPLYVCQKRVEDNAIVLAGNERLFSRSLFASDLNLIDREAIDGALRCAAKIRYSHEASPCTVTQTGPDEIQVVFDEPQRAATSGQAVVLYDGDTVIGGGTITRSKEN